MATDPCIKQRQKLDADLKRLRDQGYKRDKARKVPRKSRKPSYHTGAGMGFRG